MPYAPVGKTFIPPAFVLEVSDAVGERDVRIIDGRNYTMALRGVAWLNEAKPGDVLFLSQSHFFVRLGKMTNLVER